MNTVKSYTEVMAERVEAYKKKICKLLHWTDIEYGEFQLQTGIAYLYWYLPCDEIARYKLERSKLYWNWYKSAWIERDYAYATSEGIDKISLRERLRIYNDLHCPRVMVLEHTPNSVVLSDIQNISINV